VAVGDKIMFRYARSVYVGTCEYIYVYIYICKYICVDVTSRMILYVQVCNDCVHKSRANIYIYVYVYIYICVNKYVWM